MKPIYNKALKLAVPMMIQNGIANAVSLVDNLMVGSLGTEAMTAVSIVGQLIFVFSLAVFGGLSGPGIYGAQYYGSGNKEDFKNTFRLKHIICFVILIVGMLVFTFADKQLIGLYLNGESADIDRTLTLSYSQSYMKIMIIGLIPFVFTQIYAGSLRETGETFSPMVAGIISVAVDVILNYILIFGHFGMPRMGVDGAAVATVAARFVECLIVLVWANLHRSRHTFLVGVYKKIFVPRKLALKIIIKGLPIFLNEFLWAAGIAAITQAYSSRGLDVVAGLNISNAICNMLNVVFIALGNAVGILIGQELGASEYENAQKDSFSLMKFTGIVCSAIMLVLILLSGVFPKAYETTETVRTYGTYFIFITAVFFPLQGYLNALYFTLRAGGKTFITFLFDSVFTWVVTFPVCLLLCYKTSFSVPIVYALVQAVDIIKVTVGFILIRKGIWISNLAEETAEE